MRRIVVYGLGWCLMLAAVVLAVRTEVEPTHPPASQAVAGVDEWICPPGSAGRVACAYVSVPEDYSDPEINDVRLFTARIEPPLPIAEPPIAFVGEDLGRVSVVELGEWQRLARELGREVVLIDMRGSGRSEPRLACSELRGDVWLGADLTGSGLDEAHAEVAELLAACRDRLAGEIPLAAYSLDAMAHDLDIVRDLLGIDEWVLVAGGDASFVARRTEELFGDGVASLVLLGAVRSSENRHVSSYEGARSVLSEALGPELSDKLDEAAESLTGRSIIFPVQFGGQTRRIAINDAVILPVIARALADDDFRASAENFIGERLQRDQWRGLALLRDRQRRAVGAASLPVRLSVLCGDPSVTEVDGWLGGAELDSRWLGLFDDPTFDPEMCTSWSAAGHPGVASEPGAPTLVINGEFDSAAPASAADEIESAWQAASVVTLADTGTPSIFDSCTTALVGAFLTDTTPKMDAACT